MVGSAIALLASCSEDGTTAKCGDGIPLYDIDDVDDSGKHPDKAIEDARQKAIDAKCMTGIGQATSVGGSSGTQDSGND
jgi:hypothetical protein